MLDFIVAQLDSMCGEKSRCGFFSPPSMLRTGVPAAGFFRAWPDNGSRRPSPAAQTAPRPARSERRRGPRAGPCGLLRKPIDFFRLPQGARRGRPRRTCRRSNAAPFRIEGRKGAPAVRPSLPATCRCPAAGASRRRAKSKIPAAPGRLGSASRDFAEESAPIHCLRSRLLQRSIPFTTRAADFVHSPFPACSLFFKGFLDLRRFRKMDSPSAEQSSSKGLVAVQQSPYIGLRPPAWRAASKE